MPPAEQQATRRMAETAALLADELFPEVPLRQWVISFPFPLRFLFAAHPGAMGKVLGIVYRAISTHLTHKDGLKRKEGATGAVTLLQRFGSALNLNVHFAEVLPGSLPALRSRRPLIEFWITCAGRNRMHLLNRSWCHTRELHLARCLFSQERSPHYHSSTSRGTTEYQIGIDSCGLQPENDSKRSASGPMQARFQHTRWPSLGSIHVKHRDAGRKNFPMAPLFVLYLGRIGGERPHLTLSGQPSNVLY